MQSGSKAEAPSYLKTSPPCTVLLCCRREPAPSRPASALFTTPSSIMNGESSSTSSAAKTTAKRPKKSKGSGRNAQPKAEQIESLPWNEAISEEDPFSLISGGTEGGFLSLEEIDEEEYGLVGGAVGSSPGSRKRKERNKGGKSGDDDSCVIDSDGEKDATKRKQKKKPKKKKKKAEAQVNEETTVEELPKATEGHSEGSEDSHVVDESEFYAWNELRLHPLLMKSIYRLGFKEPTPIQKACIPAAAHQGKDVIGAAETGSGKTLAFGLPILQRLLDEREKSCRLLEQVTISKLESQGSPLRALIVTPTRELALQVTDHLKEAAKLTDVRVVPIVGGMYAEKQERLLKRKPEVVVGTPGRLWELMSGGNQHLAELHSLSFFVLDEADRMIENGHFRELQSIIDMLPTGSVSNTSQISENCETVLNVQRKKRQTCVFSATIALSDGFRKKLKRGFSRASSNTTKSLSSIETLSERAGMRPDVAVVDLTNASIMAEKLEESFIECTEENKEVYLYYILSVHGQGRTIVFCTSIDALRRISSLMNILGTGNAWTLHAQMQQRARLKAIDRFRANENGVLIATDVAARGLDIPGVRTVVHYQLPHSAEVYIHRSGRTARASEDGCSIALISPNDRMNFFSLCKSLSKDNLLRFPVDQSYMPELLKRMSLARQIDRMLRKDVQENVQKSWFQRNAKSMDLLVEESESEEEVVTRHRQKKRSKLQLQKLQQELKSYLDKPLQTKQFSRKYLAGAGVSPILQRQLEELSKWQQGEVSGSNRSNEKRPKLVVIGQDTVEPLEALRNSGHEVCLNSDRRKETRKLAEAWKKKRRDSKKREREERRKKRKNLKAD